MSKYAPLENFLQGQRVGEVRMSFSDIERVLGFKLPPSQKHRAWWSNNPSNNVMTKAWLSAGFETEQVDIERRKLVFRRRTAGPGPSDPTTGGKGGRGARPPHPPTAGPVAEEKAHPLLGWMKGLTIVAPGVDLTEPSDPEWGDRW